MKSYVSQAGGDVVSAALTQKFDCADLLPSVDVTDRGTGLYELRFTIIKACLLFPGSPLQTLVSHLCPSLFQSKHDFLKSKMLM